MATVLMVEDSLEAQALLKNILSSLGADVVTAATLEEARKQLKKIRPALILLDIRLPDGDGFQFCGEFLSNEATRSIPFIFISGNEDVTAKVAAFAMGAEDYIVKPFNQLELKSRLEARLKKIATQQGASTLLKKGALHIDAAKQRVWIVIESGQEALSLTPREFKILFHLAQNEEAIIARSQLLDAVWGSDISVFDRTVDTHISAIRKKLGSYSRYIESVPGMGYRFSSTAHP